MIRKFYTKDRHSEFSESEHLLDIFTFKEKATWCLTSMTRSSLGQMQDVAREDVCSTSLSHSNPGQPLLIYSYLISTYIYKYVIIYKQNQSSILI